MLKNYMFLSLILSAFAFTADAVPKATCGVYCTDKCKKDIEKELENVRITPEGYQNMLSNCVKTCKEECLSKNVPN